MGCAALSVRVRHGRLNFGVYILRLKTTLACVAVPEFDGLAPLGPAQAALHCVAHELFRSHLFPRGGFLDFPNQFAGKSDVFGGHASIFLLFPQLSQPVRSKGTQVQLRSELKPDVFSILYGPPEEAAEKCGTGQKRRTSGAKARRVLNYLRPD
jgi:hypothetical protein